MRKRYLFSGVALVLALLCFPVSAAAFENRVVTDTSGRPVFDLRFYDMGERYTDKDVSTWQLTDAHKNAIFAAATQWADILGPGAANSIAAPISVGTMEEENAGAESPLVEKGDGAGNTQLADALIHNRRAAGGALGEIAFGKLLWGEASPPSPLPAAQPGVQVMATMFHELGHALGIVSSAEGKAFGSVLSVWDAGLRDAFGKAAGPGMSVSSDPADKESAFIALGDDSFAGVFFTGAHVRETLNGARIAFPSNPGGTTPPGVGPVPGLPINGWENGSAEFSHIELQNSLMSHQDWRNWNTFMEAELALMQDLGYAIDRRNWYGYSVYNSGTPGAPRVFVNANPYWARNAAGDGWRTGVPNTALYGIGLHLYGSYNDVLQVADLRADGPGGTGVRVDGESNRVSIAPGVRVSADGTGGAGLLAAYGRDQRIISRGDVSALGYGGTAARFDFGGNIMGDATEYRGSWMRVVNGARDDLPDELKGPLVERFDVSGDLSGSAAAVYIAKNAWVKNINILRGAALYGDIISEWDPANTDINDSAPTDRTTALTFGLLADVSGQAQAAADPDFRLRYDGNIRGANSIHMSVNGGALSFNGSAALLDVKVAEGATLGGNAAYELYDAGVAGGGTFTNEGTLAPGNSIGAISITGKYVQTGAGVLAMEFDASGRTDRLEISGPATINGSLHLAPVRDYYDAPVAFSFADMVSAPSLSGSLPTSNDAPALTVASPTLAMGVTNSGGIYTVTTSRAPDAYSRYADGGGQREVAAVFDRLGSRNVTGDMRNLMAALDFSAPDGNQLPTAYDQLGPDMYNRTGQAAVAAQRGVSAALLASRLLTGSARGDSGLSGGDAADRLFFLIPLGGARHEEGYGNSGYGGALAGMEKERAAGPGRLTLGTHLAFLHRVDTFSGSGVNRSKTESFYAGGHGRYLFDAAPDAYLFGLARVGVESTEQKRSVDFNGYARRAEADWLSPSGTLLAGAGWNFRPRDGLMVGPVAWLDYSLAWRPSVTEHGGGAIDLHVDDQLSQSLRSSLGGRMEVSLPVERGSLEATLTAVWNHELLHEYGRARARFADYGDGTAFSRTGEARDRDTISLALSLTGQINETFGAALIGGTDMGAHTDAAWGGVQLKWTF